MCARTISPGTPWPKAYIAIARANTSRSAIWSVHSLATCSLASPITRLIASESCCPGTGGRAADKRLQARCASHAPFRFAKRHPRATRNACPLTCQLMSKLLMGGVNVEGVVRRTLTTERRSYISSRAISAQAFAGAVRSHWAIENNLHWTLDMTFQEDQSRLRAGHGAKNMAVVRHFALNLVRQAGHKRSIKRRRKRASWDPQYLLQILQPIRC